MKILWIILVVGVSVRDTKGAIIRDVVEFYQNRLHPDNANYEKMAELLQTLAKRVYLICRASMLANSYYSEYNGVDENFVEFNPEDVDDFTFKPATSEKPSSNQKEENIVQAESDSSSTTAAPKSSTNEVKEVPTTSAPKKETTESMIEPQTAVYDDFDFQGDSTTKKVTPSSTSAPSSVSPQQSSSTTSAATP